MEEAIRWTDNKKAKKPMEKAVREYQKKAAIVARGPTSNKLAGFMDGRGVGQPEMDSAGAVLAELLAKTICITGLPTESAVREFCNRFGAVLGVTMVHKSSKSKSWAFVTFVFVDDAGEAIRVGRSAIVPGKEIVVTLHISATTREVTVQIKGAADAGAKKSRKLAAHVARVSLLTSGPIVSSEEEVEEEGNEEEEKRKGDGAIRSCTTCA